MTITYDFWDIIHQIDRELERIGWSKESAQDYLEFAYGVTSRLKLNDLELLEFLDFLKNRPAEVEKFKIEIRKPRLPTLKRFPNKIKSEPEIPPF